MLSLAERVAPVVAAASLGARLAAGIVSIGGGIGTRRARLRAVSFEECQTVCRLQVSWHIKPEPWGWSRDQPAGVLAAGTRSSTQEWQEILTNTGLQRLSRGSWHRAGQRRLTSVSREQQTVRGRARRVHFLCPGSCCFWKSGMSRWDRQFCWDCARSALLGSVGAGTSDSASGDDRGWRSVGDPYMYLVPPLQVRQPNAGLTWWNIALWAGTAGLGRVPYRGGQNGGGLADLLAYLLAYLLACPVGTLLTAAPVC